MKNLSHLIQGLQIIKIVEKKDVQITTGNTYLFIDIFGEYTSSQIRTLEKLGFIKTDENIIIVKL